MQWTNIIAISISRVSMLRCDKTVKKNSGNAKNVLRIDLEIS